MDNITWSKKSSATHDNGERNMCWRVGNSPETDGTYLVTTIHEDVRPFHYRGLWYDEIHPVYPKENIIAYMKLPKPYKPD